MTDDTTPTNPATPYRLCPAVRDAIQHNALISPHPKHSFYVAGFGVLDCPGVDPDPTTLTPGLTLNDRSWLTAREQIRIETLRLLAGSPFTLENAETIENWITRP